MRPWACPIDYIPARLRKPDIEGELPAAPTQVERCESITQSLRSCEPGFHECPGFRRGCQQCLRLYHARPYWLWRVQAA